MFFVKVNQLNGRNHPSSQCNYNFTQCECNLIDFTSACQWVVAVAGGFRPPVGGRGKIGFENQPAPGPFFGFWLTILSPVFSWQSN